jgi:hypothetical protein
LSLVTITVEPVRAHKVRAVHTKLHVGFVFSNNYCRTCQGTQSQGSTHTVTCRFCL